jgi:hypothetical protein
MQLQIFGNLTPAEITEGSITLATEKANVMPVIIICKDLATCYAFSNRIPYSIIFAGDDAGELVGILDNLRSTNTGVVLTTPAASKGADFVFGVPQAYVIHTVLPQSVVQLK